jgi:hypothetical protein
MLFGYRIYLCLLDMARYRTATDFDYWIPLEFDAAGSVQQFTAFVDDFELSLPVEAPSALN